MKHILGLTLIEILVMIAIIALILTIILPMRNVPDRMGPIGQTKAWMNRLDFLLSGYFIEKGKLPDESNWKKQLGHIFSEGITKDNWEEYFIDSWKNPIQYRIVEKDAVQTVLLYSFGKNKTDDNGTGDDIIRKIEPPTKEEIDNYKANTETAAGGGML